MNILLDYFFPITAINPTPSASTAFLKQVCVVAKPKDGGVSTGVITLCTSISQVQAKFGTNASAEVQKLFDAGMSRVYVLPMNNLALATALEGHESDFFTLLISRADFADADIQDIIAVAEVKSSRKIQDILYTSKLTGTAGDAITIDYNTGGTGGGATVSVSGNAITVQIEDGVTTAATIAAAIAAYPAANALVGTAVDAGDEDDVQAVFGAALSLQGGVDQVIGDPSGFDVGAFKGVVGVASTDDSFLATQAAIENRAAFHTTSTNKAKNLFYAFGKMLSNASNWLNQQYISMPLADDIDTLGEANALFDDKISFVISDDQYGNRLALLACGGEAIVAPYIKRNLEIDMQSAALTYISGNQPALTVVQASLLESELKKVIDLYIERKWISAGTVSVTLGTDDFVVNAAVNIAKPKAMWRILGEIRQTLEG